MLEFNPWIVSFATLFEIVIILETEVFFILMFIALLCLVLFYLFEFRYSRLFAFFTDEGIYRIGICFW